MILPGKCIHLYTRHAHSAVLFIKVNYSYLLDCREGKENRGEQVNRKKEVVDGMKQEGRQRERERRGA